MMEGRIHIFLVSASLFLLLLSGCGESLVPQVIQCDGELVASGQLSGSGATHRLKRNDFGPESCLIPGKGRNGSNAFLAKRGDSGFHYQIDSLVGAEHFAIQVWAKGPLSGGMLHVLGPEMEKPLWEWQARKHYESPEAGWVKLVVDITVPERMAGKSLHVFLEAAGKDSLVFFDDFRVERFPRRPKDSYHRRGIFTDIRDHQTYAIVKLGGNWWMAEDLRFGKESGQYAFEEAMEAVPEGWRIPREEDWQALERYFGILEKDLEKPGGRGTNLSYRLLEGGDSGLEFEPTTENKAHPYWSSSPASDSSHWARFIPRHTGIGRAAAIDKRKMKVRCVMDR